ncbi:MFS transporter [Thermocladium modestius]|uniref:MFS transporter n=1 Tax=Thermocladium modestius TaxID=62609 RepID=A0A830GVX6_9CREN|nr:MFS transporter [Thermocladium modestius]GGP20908.1 MFS transporter [Thermocladium modestius]
MAKLRLYIMLQNIANGLAQPFISFLAAVGGAGGPLLGLVSSANSFFWGVVQLPLSYSKARPGRLLLLGNLLLALLWVLLGLFGPIDSIIYTAIYVGIASLNGLISFAWLLVMEELSKGSRGRVLAEYSFFGSVGGLIATLLAGLWIGRSLAAASYVFYVTAAILALNSINVIGITISERQRLPGPSAPPRFYLVTTLFAVTWSFSWPLFPLAQVYVFDMTTTNVAIISVIAGVSTLALQRRVGRMVDGHRRTMMFLGRLGLITFPLAYALSPNVYWIYVANVVSGFTNSVSNTAYMAYLFDNAKDRNKAIGLYNAVYGAATLLGSIMGGWASSLVIPYLGIRRGLDLLFTADAAARASMAVLYLTLDDASLRPAAVAVAKR